MRRALLYCLLLFAVPAAAQVVEAANCVYHEGDDQAWARPDYDDSQWLAE